MLKLNLMILMMRFLFKDMTKVVVDGDVLVYSCGFAAQKNIHTVRLGDKIVGQYEYKKEMMEEIGGMEAPFTITTEVVAEPVQNALHNVKLMMEQIIDECRATKYKVYLSGENNYRKEIYPEYKANRDSTHKPVHYSRIKDYILGHWNGATVEGIEADDAIGIAGYGYDCIMASIDKDLLMIPGTHYHLKSNKQITIKEAEGNLIFLRQWLTGDVTDNIPGIKGLGPKKAEKILPDGIECSTGWLTVMENYPTTEEAELNGSLVWILREELKERNQKAVMDQVKRLLSVGSLER